MENSDNQDQIGKVAFESTHTQPELSVELSSNAAVEKLVVALNTSPLDWDVIIQRLTERGWYKHRSTKGGLGGVALEEHVHLVTQGMINRGEGYFLILLNLKLSGISVIKD